MRWPRGGGSSVTALVSQLSWEGQLSSRETVFSKNWKCPSLRQRWSWLMYRRFPYPSPWLVHSHGNEDSSQFDWSSWLTKDTNEDIAYAAPMDQSRSLAHCLIHQPRSAFLRVNSDSRSTRLEAGSSAQLLPEAQRIWEALFSNDY